MLFVLFLLPLILIAILFYECEFVYEKNAIFLNDTFMQFMTVFYAGLMHHDFMNLLTVGDENNIKIVTKVQNKHIS